MSDPLWTPPDDRVAASGLARFARAVGREVAYPELHRWSVESPQQFWAAAWTHLVPSVALTGPAVIDADEMLGASWYPEVRLNVAERILAGDSDPAAVPADDDPMLVSVDERGRRRELSRRDAVQTTAQVAAALRAAGVGPGDRVAAWMPNTLETVLAMLGAASVGAVFSSCSPDFGADGVLDRFGQIGPTVLVAADGYTYAGRALDRREELVRITAGLTSLRQLVVVPFLSRRSRPVRTCPMRRTVRMRRSGQGRRSSRGPTGSHRTVALRPTTNRWVSITPGTCCSARGPPACPSASCIAPAACSCST